MPASRASSEGLDLGGDVEVLASLHLEVGELALHLLDVPLEGSPAGSRFWVSDDIGPSSASGGVEARTRLASSQPWGGMARPAGGLQPEGQERAAPVEASVRGPASLTCRPSGRPRSPPPPCPPPTPPPRAAPRAPPSPPLSPRLARRGLPPPRVDDPEGSTRACPRGARHRRAGRGPHGRGYLLARAHP